MARPKVTCCAVPLHGDVCYRRLQQQFGGQGKSPSHPDPDRNLDMARTLPDGWEALAAAGAAPYEIATLRRLAAELPDDHAIFDGVHWTRLDHGYSVFGEVDFIVVGPQGQAILIEQKNGALEETLDGLVKHYTGKTKGVARQIHRSLASLQSRFQQGHAGLRAPKSAEKIPRTRQVPLGNFRGHRLTGRLRRGREGSRARAI
jgi:Nuclease-related domain